MGTLIKTFKKLGNYARYGLTGSPAPRGIVSSEAWAAEHPDLCRLVKRDAAGHFEVPDHPRWPSDAAGPARSAVGSRVELPLEFELSIDGGRVTGRTGSVITPDNLLLGDVSISWRNPLSGDVSPAPPKRESKILRGGPLPRPRDLGEALVVLAYPLCDNFYHWMADTLPRLGRLDGTDGEPRRYYAPTRTRFQRESLQLLEIDSSRVLPTTRFTHLRAAPLVVPSGGKGYLSPAACSWLREFLLPAALAKAPAVDGKRFYISRRNARARHRRVVNEGAVVSHLTARGFRCLHFEQLSLAEQIRTLHEAELVVAAHGAALVHLAFCEEGARVLEIGTPRRRTPLFYVIACLRRLPYLELVGREAGPVYHRFDSDIEIDLAHLDAGLDWLEAAPPPPPIRVEKLVEGIPKKVP